MFTISPQIKETYFRKSYANFKMMAEALAKTDYKAFAGINGYSALSQTLDIFNASFEDRQGIYIYLPESCELVTLDCWLRTADFSKPFYFGGTVRYHC